MAKQSPKPKSPHIRAKDRETFTSNLAMLLKAGVPVSQTLASIKESTSSKPLQKAMDAMMIDIDSGASLSTALENSGLVTRQTLTLARLGEQAGNLAENLQVASVQEQKQRATRAKIQTALLYPGFVLGITVAVGIGVAWFLLPQLSETFASMNANLPTITKIFLGFGNFLKQNGLWFVPLLIVTAIGLGSLVAKVPKVRSAARSFFLHFPGIGRLLRETEVVSFGSLLGALLQAGLSVTESLSLLSETAETNSYRKMYSQLQHDIEDGYSFAASFKQQKKLSKLLPAGVQQMVIAGEKSGALPQSLQNVGTIYEQKASTTVDNLQAVMEPILLVIIWVGVLGVAVAVILPIYSLVGGLGG